MCALAVGHFPTAQSWYERFFDHTADVIANESEQRWKPALPQEVER